MPDIPLFTAFGVVQLSNTFTALPAVSVLCNTTVSYAVERIPVAGSLNVALHFKNLYSVVVRFVFTVSVPNVSLLSETESPGVKLSPISTSVPVVESYQ